MLYFQSRTLRLGVPGCVHCTVNSFSNARVNGRETMTTLKDEGAVSLRDILCNVVCRRREHVSESVAETGFADKHV